MNLVEFIREQSQSLRELVNLLPIPIFYKDRNGVYLGCNKAFEEFIKISRKDLVGKTVYELFSKEIADIYFKKDEELFNNPGIQIYDGKATSSENDSYDVRFHKTNLINNDGEVTGLIGTVFDITKEMRQEKHLEKLASYDILTGLYNRRKGILLLEDEINKNKFYNLSFSIVMMDIDNFKKINDTYGHNYGDKILKEITQILEDKIKHLGIVFRHGGDEFIYYLPKMGREEAFLILEKIRKSIGKKYKDHEKKICRNISASFGIAVFPNDGNNVDHLINKADDAMYKVKISGRNGIRFASETIKN